MFYNLKKRIQLVNAPLDSTFCPSIRAGAFPPLNLASLVKFVHSHEPDVEVEIIDGELDGIDGIISKLNSDFIGISCNSLSYASALKIAKISKSNGAIVVLGGAHPSFLGKHIIKNRTFIDAVVYGDGEWALLEIIRGKKWADIPNLIYRYKGNIYVNPEKHLDIESVGIPEYANINLESYFSNYSKLYPDKPFRRPFAVYSAKGCGWRNRSKSGCIFCAIQDVNLRIKSEKEFWKELMCHQEYYNADFFWDVSDTFTMQYDWVKHFALKKPENTNFKFQIYGRSVDINKEMAQLLAHIGVYEVFLGLESGSDEILKRINKGLSVESTLKAIEFLNNEGIKAVISIVLALPGECSDSLLATKNIVSNILSWSDLSEINCSLLLPLPGSQLMLDLQKYIDVVIPEKDIFEPTLVREAWVDRFCNVSYMELIKMQDEIMNLHYRVGAFGLSVFEKEIMNHKIS